MHNRYSLPSVIWRKHVINVTTYINVRRTHWDLEKNAKIMDFEGHNGDVVSMSLAPDSNTYVTGSVDQSCKLWDTRSPDCKQVFYGHTADVNCVCVSVQKGGVEDERISPRT